MSSKHIISAVSAAPLLALLMFIGSPPVNASGDHSDDSSYSTSDFSRDYATAAGIDLPVAYYSVSPSILGLSEEDQGPMTIDSELFGEMFDPETGVGYIALARNAESVRAQAVRTAPRIEASSLAKTNGWTPTDNTATLSNEILVITSKYTASEVINSLDTLAAHFSTTGVTVAFGYDPRFDAIKISGELSKEDLDAIPQTSVPHYLEPGVFQNVAYNEDTRTPFVGGAAIFDQRKVRCTSGIPAKNANGTAGYFTAGHCFSLSSHVWTSSSLAGASNSGRVTHYYNPRIDAQFVSGKSYSGHIYAGFTRKPIIGTWHPKASAGNRICFQGSTTGNICSNQLISYGQQACTESICYTNLIALRGGASAQHGDSGGPAYANFGNSVRVTGLVSGILDPLFGQTTTYLTDWRAIRNNYNATLIYG